MHGDLLWVYEGLTEYLGWLIAARSGMISADDARTTVARQVDYVDVPGRSWRPLVDTAVASQILYGSGGNGGSMRRHADYYPEGFLIWLEADVLIRKKTNGARSLDDFCQRFFGGASGPPEVRPYDLEEVLSTLEAIAPANWRAFFESRVDRVAPVPLGGIEGAGYKVVFTDQKPEPHQGARARLALHDLLALARFRARRQADHRRRPRLAAPPTRPVSRRA